MHPRARGAGRHKLNKDRQQRLAELTPFERAVIDGESDPTVNEAVADALNETEKRLETNLGTSIQKIEDQQGHLTVHATAPSND